MKPILFAVIVKAIDEDESIVEIKYKGSQKLTGIELHGVDAGLSWLKGESIEFEDKEKIDENIIYATNIQVKTSCEFRARGYFEDEDHWEEGKNHQIIRLPSGSIELHTSHAILDVIEFQPDPPKLYVPTLKSVKVSSTDELKTVVDLEYEGSNEIDGIEIHGVDAGLSWLKGESLELITSNIIDNLPNMTCQLEIVDSCEFKARAYKAEVDLWEEGTNHKLVRLEDGRIELQTDDDKIDNIEFRSYPPVDYDPKLEVITNRFQDVSDVKTRIFQLLADLPVWINDYILDPLNHDSIRLLPIIIRNLKLQGRQFNSHQLDLVTLPLIKALYVMYTSVKEFHDEDIRILIDEWEKMNFEELFITLPDKVKELDGQELGSEEDADERKRELWKYN